MVRVEDIPIFAMLEKEDLKKISEDLLIKHYKKDSILFYEGERSEFLHILIQGDVKLYKTSPKGTQVQINRLSAPSLIAEFVCFEEESFPATCEFVTDGSVGLLHFKILYKYLSIPAFSMTLIRSLTKKVLLLSSLLHQETILSSEAKIAHLMIKKYSIFNRLKNNEIASMLNITPETFSRIISRFKKEQIIHFENHKLKILDQDKLYNIVETNRLKECTHCIDRHLAK